MLVDFFPCPTVAIYQHSCIVLCKHEPLKVLHTVSKQEHSDGLLRDILEERVKGRPTIAKKRLRCDK